MVDGTPGDRPLRMNHSTRRGSDVPLRRVLASGAVLVFGFIEAHSVPTPRDKRAKRVLIDGSSLTLEQVEAIADGTSCSLAATPARSTCGAMGDSER